VIWPKLRKIWSLPTHRCTDNARSCFSIAWNIAETMNHPSVTPEHLLAGLIYQSEQSSRSILRRLRLEWDASVLIPPAEPEKPTKPIDFDPSTRSILNAAREQAQGLNKSYVGTEHLLWALLNGPPGPARRFLESRGLTSQAISA
jgi:ATP-dependent Clp protease ATP-binding subunit ClpC